MIDMYMATIMPQTFLLCFLIFLVLVSLVFN